MVSKASDDLPEPDSPVMTVRLSRGMSTSTFLRLCSRAPRTLMLPAIWLLRTPAASRLVFCKCSGYMAVWRGFGKCVMVTSVGRAEESGRWPAA